MSHTPQYGNIGAMINDIYKERDALRISNAQLVAALESLNYTASNNSPNALIVKAALAAARLP